jgi:hypothetical protein
MQDSGDATGAGGESFPRDADRWREVHGVLLTHSADSIGAHLERILEHDVLGQLRLIWERHPGWTTPAEFLLAFTALDDIQTRVAHLETSIERVFVGSEVVLSGEYPGELPDFPQHSTAWRGGHDLELLNRLVEESESSLRRIADRNALRELIPIWRKPGWTTPAEFSLVHSALEDIATQVEALERKIGALARGAALVEAGSDG